jgi:hypothetical protein
LPNSAANKDILWTSDNPDVACIQWFGNSARHRRCRNNRNHR